MSKIHRPLCVMLTELYRIMSLNTSPFTFGCPSSYPVCYRRDFPLGIYKWQSFMVCLQPYVFINHKQVTFKQWERARSANTTTTLSQQAFLLETNEMLTHQRRTGDMGKVRALMIFLFLCPWFEIRNYMNVFLQKLHLTSFIVAEMKNRLKR